VLGTLVRALPFSGGSSCAIRSTVSHRLRLLFLVAAVLSPSGGDALAEPMKATPQPSSVAVIFALKSQRERLVPWRSDLTIDTAIQAAAPSGRASWKQAWRRRESFWTRNFRNPHSFWARLLAGEKATGFTYFQNAPPIGQTATLQPGDKLYVDLAPID
jgi:hypothetical protein